MNWRKIEVLRECIIFYEPFWHHKLIPFKNPRISTNENINFSGSDSNDVWEVLASESEHDSSLIKDLISL